MLPNSNHSLTDLKTQANRIVTALQTDQDFCQKAANNPIEALRQLGFSLDSPAIRKLEAKLAKQQTVKA